MKNIVKFRFIEELNEVTTVERLTGGNTFTANNMPTTIPPTNSSKRTAMRIFCPSELNA